VLGGLLADQGRPAEAQKAWQAAVSLPDVPGPVAGVVLEGLARLAVVRGDAEVARANAESAMAADPAVPVAAYIDGRLKQEAGDDEGALAAFDTVVEASRTAHRRIEDLSWRRGDALARLDRFAEAERAYREAIEEHPHDARPFISLVTLYRAMQQDPEAAVTVDALMRAVPTASGYAQAARLWQVLGDKERADATRAAARERFGPEPGTRPPSR
jgi:tetratricopeptide (TPR) repeat protein